MIFIRSDSSSDKPKGSIPKPLQQEELHDEMDDWYCKTFICYNKYCQECFFHAHQSESAD